MTYDIVWCVIWHPTGQYDQRCHIKFFITQPPSNNWFIVLEGKIFSNRLSLDDLGEMLAFNYHYLVT